MSSSGDRPSRIYAFPQSTGRASAASGLVAAVLLIVSFAVVPTDIPTYDDSPREFARFYANNSSSIQLSSLLGIFGGAAFIWFAGYLRWTFGMAEQTARGFERATPVVFGAAIAGVAVGFVFNAAHEAAVVAQGTVEPGVVRAFDLFAAYAIAGAAVLFSVFMFSAFFLIRVTKVLPEWLAYVALIGTPLGIVQAFLLIAPQDDNGLLGAIGYAWFATFLLWTIGASATLARRAS